MLGRRIGTYSLRGGYALLVLGIVSLVFLATMTSLENQQGAARLQAQSTIAPNLATTVGWIQFIVLTLAAPLLTANCICDEKMKRTLPSLATTPMHATQIIFGKLTSRMVQLLLLVLLALPVLLIIRVYGGLEARTVAAMTGLTIGSATLAGSVGMMYSVWHRRPWAVIIMSILTMVLLYAGPPIVLGIMSIYWPGLGTSLLIGGYWLCPPLTMGFVHAETYGNPIPTPISVWQGWMLCMAACLVLATLIGIFASTTLRRVMLAEAGGWSPTRSNISIPGMRKRGGASKRKSRRSRRVWDQPVLWREMHQTMLGSRLNTIVVIGLILAALGFIYARVAWLGMLDDPVIHLPMIAIFSVVHLLLASTATTHVIASERDARTIDVLSTTPLSASSIVVSKFIGGLYRVRFVPMWMIAHATIFAMLGYLSWWTLALLAMFIVSSTIFLCGTGILMSVHCRGAMRASIMNLLIIVMLWFVLPILTFFIGNLLFPLGLDEHPLFKFVLAINPVYMLVSSTVAGLGDEGYHVIEEVSGLEFGAWATVVTIGYIGTGFGALLMAIGIFTRSAGRRRF